MKNSVGTDWCQIKIAKQPKKFKKKPQNIIFNIQFEYVEMAAV